MGILWMQETQQECDMSTMAVSRESIHASLVNLIDRMEQYAFGDDRLSGFGRSTIRNVIEQLRVEAVRRVPDHNRVRDALHTWTAVLNEEFLAGRLEREFQRLHRSKVDSQ